MNNPITQVLAPTRLRGYLLVHGAGVGLATAVAAGVADALMSRTEYVDAGFLWLAVSIWVVCAAPIVGILTIISSAVVNPSRSRSWRAPSRIAGMQIAAPLVLVVWIGSVIWVNINFFGTATEWPSVCADVAITIAAGAATVTIGAGFAQLYRRAGIELAIVGVWLTTCACAAAFLIVSYLSWPQVAGAVKDRSEYLSPNSSNVVLILIDTLRRDHVSVEGYDRVTTPAIDRLARSGVRFERCMSQSSHTKPAVASLLTSSYLATHGADGPHSVLADGHTTLVEAFRRAGYRTGMFVANPVVSPNQGYAQGAERFWGLRGMLSHQTVIGYGFTKLRHQPLVHETAANALRLIEGIERTLLGSSGSEVLMTSASEVVAAFLSWQEMVNGDPYFAYLHFGEPHAPYCPPPEQAAHFSSPSEPFVSDHPATSGRLLPFSPSPALPAPARGGMIRAYDGEILHVDVVVGELLKRLEALDDGRDTIIVVTSDHGEEFYEHHSWGHGQSLYNELLEVPLVMSGRGFAPRTVVPHLVELIDIAPTLLAAAGLPIPETMHGKSLLPLIHDPINADRSRAALAEVEHRTNCWARCLVEGQYKLIVAYQNTREIVELYDLAADPNEFHNLALDHPQLVDRMRTELQTRLSTAEATRVGSYEIELDSTTEERLRALGYLD